MSWLTLRGNIGGGGDSSCGSGATWEYNIWAQRKCSSTDVQNSNITASANYLGRQGRQSNTAGAPSSAPPPPHPKSTQATQPSGPPPTPTAPPRPNGGRADAGPYEPG